MEWPEDDSVIASNSVVCMDALELLEGLDDKSVSLLWTDPPFGTGKMQSQNSTLVNVGRIQYLDKDPRSIVALIMQLAPEIERVLKDDGVLALLFDYRVIHEAVTAVRSESNLKYRGEIIYHFELGGIAKKWWSNKHNTIAMFTKDSPKFYFDRIPTTERKAPRGDYTSEKRKVNSVWTYTMGSSDSERAGYPNQKPLAIVEPFVLVHTDPGDLCVDPFCGSGTLGAAAKKNGRNYILGDTSPEAVEICRNRLL